jgi:hypothetical protein
MDDNNNTYTKICFIIKQKIIEGYQYKSDFFVRIWRIIRRNFSYK